VFLLATGLKSSLTRLRGRGREGAVVVVFLVVGTSGKTSHLVYTYVFASFVVLSKICVTPFREKDNRFE